MLATGFEDEDRAPLLPRPEDLPPLEQRNDTAYTLLWLVGILACLVVIVMLGRGLF
jgi:hypothetical protein